MVCTQMNAQHRPAIAIAEIECACLDPVVNYAEQDEARGNPGGGL